MGSIVRKKGTRSSKKKETNLNFLKLFYNNKIFLIRQIIHNDKPVLIGTIDLLFHLDQHGNADLTENSKIIVDSISFFVSLFDFYLPDENIMQKDIKDVAK